VNQAVDTIVFVLTILGLPITLGLACFVFWGYKFLQKNRSKPTDTITVPDGEVIRTPDGSGGHEIGTTHRVRQLGSPPRVD
jgi:hypothetical protein